MTDKEYQELEELREIKRRWELTEADRANEKVLLLEGKLDRYEGEYSALSVNRNGTTIYILEAIQNFINYQGKDVISFQYHISEKPMGFYALEEHMTKMTLGIIDITFRHCYSDLTGYLWTNEDLKIGGHDLLEELNSHVNCSEPMYLALRIEKK